MTVKAAKPTRRKSATPPDQAPSHPSTVDDAAGFEAAMQELETLVERLENGDIALDESLNLFERGIGLTRACQQALDRAEQKVQVLTAGTGPEPSSTKTPEQTDLPF